MLKVIEDLKSELTMLFKEENTGHDISHLIRVYDYAIDIQNHEGGDLYIVAVGALVHDVHRLMSNKCGYYISGEESVDEVRNLLLRCNVDLNKLESILDIVKNHDHKENKNQSIETLIVQDADALDAIGDIGLERTLKYCKKHDIPISNTNYPLDTKEYIPDINPISTCHYVYNTMIKEAKNLYTKRARELSLNKLDVLERFVKENYRG